jgi:hypothetical protein
MPVNKSKKTVNTIETLQGAYSGLQHVTAELLSDVVTGSSPEKSVTGHLVGFEANIMSVSVRYASKRIFPSVRN